MCSIHSSQVVLLLWPWRNAGMSSDSPFICLFFSVFFFLFFPPSNRLIHLKISIQNVSNFHQQQFLIPSTSDPRSPSTLTLNFSLYKKTTSHSPLSGVWCVHHFGFFFFQRKRRRTISFSSGLGCWYDLDIHWISSWMFWLVFVVIQSLRPWHGLVCVYAENVYSSSSFSFFFSVENLIFWKEEEKKRLSSMAVVCVSISFAAFPLWLMTEWLASSLLTNSHPSSGFQPLRGLCVYAEIGTGPCALCTFITMKSIPCLCLLPISLSLYIACRFGRRVNVHATCLPLFRFFTVLFFFLFYFFFSPFLISILQLCHDLENNNRREHLVYSIHIISGGPSFSLKANYTHVRTCILAYSRIKKKRDKRIRAKLESTSLLDILCTQYITTGWLLGRRKHAVTTKPRDNCFIFPYLFCFGNSFANWHWLIRECQISSELRRSSSTSW